MADVKFDNLKPAAKAMFDNAKKANDKVKNLDTWADKGADKATWASIKQHSEKALESSDKLNKFALAGKEDGAEQAGKDMAAAVEAAREALRLVTPLKATAKEDSDEWGGLSVLVTSWGLVTKREKQAQDALGVTGAAPSAAPTPGTGTGTGTGKTDQPAAIPTAQQAVDAAAEALRQAGEAETQANAIEKADDAKVKDIADKVVVAAKAVKTKAADAKAQAEKARAGAKDSEKQAWDDAVKAAEAVAKPAADLETAATTVAGKTKPEDIKKQATDSKLPALATAAKTAADDAKKKVETAKGAAPSGVQADNRSGGTAEKKEEKKEAKKTPNSFGASITAAYSRKFSLDTTVHSKVEVTMVPYPPPQQFLDWIRAHYNQEHPTSTAPKP
jgi:hypothetical protein